MSDEDSKSGNLAENLPPMSGPSSAAVLLMAVGEENAASVLQHMGPEEVQRIGEAMSEIGSVSQGQIGVTLDSFVQKLETQTTIGAAPRSYLVQMLERALGKERALSVLAQINKDCIAPALESLKWLPDPVVAKLIGDEHPQFIAIILSYLSRDKAAAVLQELPQQKKADIVIRVSRLETVQPRALKEIDEILEKRFGQSFESELAGAGGIKTVAEILNGVSSDEEAAIMEELNAIDEDLATTIRDNMFVFENLLNVDDRGIQMLLRDVGSDVLVKALKGAGEDVRAKIFRNLSSRAAVLLRDDLDASGPMKLAEVEDAQKEILTIAEQMAEDGKISLGKGDDFV